MSSVEIEEALIKREKIVQNLYEAIELPLKGALLSVEVAGKQLYEQANKAFLQKEHTEAEVVLFRKIWTQSREENIAFIMQELAKKLEESTNT